ncbi:MAG: class I SAM-dependent methyltransferase [Candidatus Limnocylindrales bacterium]
MSARPTLGAVFSDAEVARLYCHRAPYPDQVLSTLRGLLVDPHAVLDVGAGTGALARRMLASGARIDAVDPSAAMIEEGRRLPSGGDVRLRWILGRAEDAPLSPPYGLITAGASLHWVDVDLALPRLRDALAPGAVMAIADTEPVHGAYWADLLAVLRAHSELDHHVETPEFVEDLRASGRFALDGQLHTEPTSFEQSIDDYIDMLHSTSTLARVRLGDRSPVFETEVRRVFARQGLDRVRFGVVGHLFWGRPV